MVLSELEKARLYLANRKSTYKELSKKSGLSIEMLKKFSENPQRLERGYYKNINKLSNLYDKQQIENNVLEIDPLIITQLHNWLNTEIPNDLLGKTLKNYIVEDKQLYFNLLKKLKENVGDDSNGRK